MSTADELTADTKTNNKTKTRKPNTKLTSVPVTKDEKKINPFVLRHVIFSIIKRDFAGSVSRAAERFNEKRSKKIRNNMTITRETLYKILSDKAHIKYLHIEAVANHLGMPCGFFLLFTRLLADDKDKDIDSYNAIINLCKIIGATPPEKKITIDDLYLWADLIKNYKNQQIELKLF